MCSCVLVVKVVSRNVQQLGDQPKLTFYQERFNSCAAYYISKMRVISFKLCAKFFFKNLFAMEYGLLYSTYQKRIRRVRKIGISLSEESTFDVLHPYFTQKCLRKI